METTFIYALCEPGTRTVRYIGKTANLRKRFRDHLSVSSRKKNHLGNWLRSLIFCGAVPKMVTLREVPEAEGSAAEIQYIRAARESLGMNLVNSTDGGEGSPGQRRSPETRAKISAAMAGEKNHQFGKVNSAETRAKKRAALVGGVLTLKHRAKISAAMSGTKHPQFGKENSAETRAKKSAALKGIPWSPARRAAHEANR